MESYPGGDKVDGRLVDFRGGVDLGEGLRRRLGLDMEPWATLA